MNLTTGTSLRFEEFWRWLREHLNCVIEAGTSSATIMDFEDFHWVLTEEDDGRRVVQMMRGKGIVGELLIDPSEVTSVEVAPDVESGSQGQWMFEVFGGAKEDPFVVAYFVMAHGFEEAGRHKVLKH